MRANRAWLEEPHILISRNNLGITITQQQQHTLSCLLTCLAVFFPVVVQRPCAHRPRAHLQN